MKKPILLAVVLLSIFGVGTARAFSVQSLGDGGNRAALTDSGEKLTSPSTPNGRVATFGGGNLSFSGGMSRPSDSRPGTPGYFDGNPPESQLPLPPFGAFGGR
ncbi:MAG: hypothetical protein M0006_08410 [Magnetospirillum sp.]|nr:hypothetical protein [Magnetospirillum sp.]